MLKHRMPTAGRSERGACQTRAEAFPPPASVASGSRAWSDGTERARDSGKMRADKMEGSGYQPEAAVHVISQPLSLALGKTQVHSAQNNECFCHTQMY